MILIEGVGAVVANGIVIGISEFIAAEDVAGLITNSIQRVLQIAVANALRRTNHVAAIMIVARRGEIDVRVATVGSIQVA